MLSTILDIILILLFLGVALVEVFFVWNIKGYLNLLHRGFVRVKIVYLLEQKEQTIRGWMYNVDLQALKNNPMNFSSEFIKLYYRGEEVKVIRFSTIRKLEILADTFWGVVLARGVYL